jgi:hypothetical protein
MRETATFQIYPTQSKCLVLRFIFSHGQGFLGGGGYAGIRRIPTLFKLTKFYYFFYFHLSVK